MSTLRARTIRLANENPDLQPLLLPILAEDTQSRVAVDIDRLTDAGKDKVRADFMDGLKSGGWTILSDAQSTKAADSLKKSGIRYPSPTASKRINGSVVYVDFVNAGTIKYYIPSGKGYREVSYGRAQPDAVLVKSAAGKKPVKNTDIRSGYYESGDKIGALESAVKADPNTKDDKALLKAVADLQKAHDAVAAALKPYAWD